MRSIRPITATILSRYVRLERCERFLWFRIKRDETNQLKQNLAVIDQPLSPLLSEAGEAFEEEVIGKLPGEVRNLFSENEQATLEIIKSLLPGQSCLLTQAMLKGNIGGWPCEGRADIIKVSYQPKGGYEVIIGDVKASDHDRVEYRLQVVFYLLLLSKMLTQSGLVLNQQKGAILRKQEDGTLPLLEDEASFFEIEPYNLILSQLLEGQDSELNRIENLDFLKVPYSLGYKCDGCNFNQLCMTDSNVRQDIALVPYIQSSSANALRANNITTLRELSELKELPPPNVYNTAFQAAKGKEELVAKLSQIQPLGVQLDRLVQRARARLKQFDSSVTAYSHLLDSPFSSLPGEQTNQDLVKIFLDAQHDFLQNRLYLLGALVKGPGGTFPLVEFTGKPPDAKSEKELLVSFLTKLVQTICQAAKTPDKAPIHLYIFDSYEQRVWLDALERHLEALCEIPALFDLLTTSPALGQPMLGILAAEIRERRNLPMTCQNLYSITTFLKFKWEDNDFNFRKLFHQQVFDNILQREDGIWVQKFSRFDSHIPLEYAYGAWKKLPKRNNQTLSAFQNCKPEHLIGFEIKRLEALAYIEAGLGAKDNRLVKETILFDILKTPTQPHKLSRALEEFLMMEHHTRLQQQQTLYALPIERRVITGRALLLKCLSVDGPDRSPRATFKIDFNGAGLPDSTRQLVRFTKGDWLVLNPADGRPFWKILNGRIAVVGNLETNTIELELRDITSYRSNFKYPHDTKLRPTPGEYYTLDEMADDLNSDKFREAVLNSSNNVFFSYLLEASPPPALEDASSASLQFYRYIENLGKKPPTKAQSEIISGHHQTPVLCVQGPPGSGKTSTLGWAVLSRLFSTAKRPIRVVVCARTHKATNLVLESIAEKYEELNNLGKDAKGVKGVIGPLLIYKVGADDPESLPKGVMALNQGNRAAVTSAFEAQVAVIGGTAGGIYTLLKQRNGGQLNWSDDKLFDLLIIDEASQMSLPEAVLAAAWLKPAGQLIVVGDHRQMPPILAHAWNKERKRNATAYMTFRSVFETLKDREYPMVGLDESFRLHRVQAEFLAINIYSKDSIAFHSKREDLLPPLPSTITDQYVRAVLRHDYPVIVIEHSESSSQQYNETELRLTEPLIRACSTYYGFDGRKGMGVVVPHNAQKAALKNQFLELAKEEAIDTVERFQGGERDVIIVSATASDPAYVLAEASFLLNLNRLNVAISRPKKKLVVIASTTIFRLLLAELDMFENALLWKRLRYQWAMDNLWQGTTNGYAVQVWGRSCGGTIGSTVTKMADTVASEIGVNSNEKKPLLKIAVPILPNLVSPLRRERNKEEW